MTDNLKVSNCSQEKLRTQSFDSYANSLKFDSIYYGVLIIDELFIIGCLMLYNNKFKCKNVLEELNMTILVNLLHKKYFFQIFVLFMAVYILYCIIVYMLPFIFNSYHL